MIREIRRARRASKSLSVRFTLVGRIGNICPLGKKSDGGKKGETKNAKGMSMELAKNRYQRAAISSIDTKNENAYLLLFGTERLEKLSA